MRCLSNGEIDRESLVEPVEPALDKSDEGEAWDERLSNLKIISKLGIIFLFEYCLSEQPLVLPSFAQL
jgi:hypothetical protein